MILPATRAALLLAVLLAATGTLAVGPAAASPATGDFSGPVDIGGRSLYLECRGQGSPTVILESGAGARADVWSADLSRPAGERTMVEQGVAAFTRVCAYDRPGTLTEANPDRDPDGPEFYPSRSDPVPQPRTTQDVMADLHALLAVAAIPGPYVLVGHSAGGLSQRLYAATYPDQVVGMVLIDSTHENIYRDFSAALPPAQWAEFEAANTDQTELLAAYPAAENLFTTPLPDTPSLTQVREARARGPLNPMPLVVLAHGLPFPAPIEGWPTEKMEQIMFAAQQDIATLVPDGRLVTATESGHNIHQNQPDLVTDAIAQVVAAVHDPGTW